MRCKVSLIPLGDKIKIQLEGKMFCTIMKQELRNSLTVNVRDMISKKLFGSYRNAKRFAGGQKTKSVVIDLSELGYDRCDKRI